MLDFILFFYCILFAVGEKTNPFFLFFLCFVRCVTSWAVLDAPSTAMKPVAHLFPVILFRLIHPIFANGVEDGSEIFVGFEKTFCVLVWIIDAPAGISGVFTNFVAVCVIQSFLWLFCGFGFDPCWDFYHKLSSSTDSRRLEKSNALYFSCDGSPYAQERRNFCVAVWIFAGRMLQSILLT